MEGDDEVGEHPDVLDEDARVDEALDRALELDPEERRAFLRTLPEDVRRTLEVLLSSADEGPLSRGVGEIAGRLLDSAGGSLDPRIQRRTIGSWRLIRRLGSGGMGVVHLAERVEGDFEQEAALKVIRWELADDALVRRFLDERRILAQLNHPHIATLLDGGMSEEGLPYLVLEYVEGRPVDQACEEDELSAVERIGLMVKIARAVDFAHRRLIVHRDLKPSNVLVREDGEPKLLDFGIAKLLDDASTTRTVHTPLTPRWAAPEQKTGGATGVAADVWSLGLMLRELVQSPEVAGWDGIDRRDLANIVSQATREEPEHRYRNAGDFADDLERCLRGQPVSATSPTVGYRLSKWIGRRRGTAAALAVGVLTALLGVGAVLWQAREARIERDRAQRETVRAEQVTAFLRNLFEGSLPSLGEEPRVRDLLDEGSRRISEEMADAPLVRAELLTTIGETYKWLDDYGRAEELIGAALEIVEELKPGSRDHALLVSHLAGVWLHRGDRDSLEQAERGFLRAWRLMEEVPGAEKNLPDDQAVRVDLLNSLGMTRLGLEDNQEALPLLERAMALAEEIDDPVRLATTKANAAEALHGLGRHRQSERALRRAIALYTAVEPESTSRGAVLTILSRSLMAQGRLEEAADVLREARDLYVSGSATPAELAVSEANLSYLLLVAGDGDGAAELAETAYRVLDGSASGQRDTIATRANLAWARALQGQMGEAVALGSSVVADLEEFLGGGHPITARGRTRYGAILHRNGRVEEARHVLERASEVLEAQSTATTVLADLRLELGAVLCDLGREDEGMPILREALPFYRQQYGDRHWLAARTLVELARCGSLSELADGGALRDSRSVLVEARGEDSWEVARADGIPTLGPDRGDAR